MPPPSQIEKSRQRRILRGDLPARCLGYLTRTPGNHRANAVAEGLGRPGHLTKEQWTRRVGSALSRLHKDGECRQVLVDIGWTRPVAHYTTDPDEAP